MDLKIRPIKNNVFYIGSKDVNRKLFDQLVPLPQGTTYNSYLIKGSEKTAIIDTDYPKKLDEYKARLLENNITNVDYIVSNHAEQDHSGGIPMLLEMFPNAKVVTNAKVKENVINMLHVDESKFIVINDGDELSLGDKTLQFIIAPFVHWPDTMFTYLKEDKMLFTCDFLGAHYTKHELFADYTEGLIEAVKRYYAEIIMPFRNFAKKYTDKVKSMDVEIILPSHGPVYDKPEWILDLYADWTSERVENKVVIPYVSMYESTKMMVERLAQNLEKAGVEVKLFDLVNFDEGELSMELVDCATVVLGSSMVLAGPHPAAVMAAYLANALRPKFRYYSIVGSYGWGGNLEGTLESMFTIIKPQKLDYVVIKGQPRKEDFEKIDNLSNEIIEKHKSL
jgi:flavorubredoxin